MTTTSITPDLDPLALRTLFGRYPSGVTAVCALIDGAPVGMAASSFVSISLEPPLVAVAFANTSNTWQQLKNADRTGINVLAQDQEAICRGLAGPSERRFDSVPYTAHPGGALRIEGAVAWLECTTFAVLPAGDHSIVLFEIVGYEATADALPLVFHESRYSTLNPPPELAIRFEDVR